MDCELLGQQEFAEKFVSGQLDAGAQEEFEIHLLECARCQQSVEALESIRTALVEAEPQIRMPSRVWWRPRWAWAAAAAMIVIVAATVRVTVSREHGNARMAEAPIAAPAPTPNRGQAPPVAQAQAPQAEKPLVAVRPATHSEPPQLPETVATAPASTPQITTASPTPAVVADGTPRQSPSKPTASNDRVAAEIFRLATVDPPPYTFAGFSNDKSGRHAPAPGYSQPGTAPTARANFQDAMAQYVGGNYAAALTLLEDADRAARGATDVNFYLGVCRLLLGRPAESIAPLKAAIGNGSSPFLQSAHYYLAKAYLQTNKLAEAETELESAVQMPGRLSAEAASLLAKLRALRAGAQGKE